MQEDIISASDSPTETYSSPIQVDPDVRTHRFVQSRVTLYTGTPGVTPVFHSLSYTFIDAGITPNPPKPQVMIQGTPFGCREAVDGLAHRLGIAAGREQSEMDAYI